MIALRCNCGFIVGYAEINIEGIICVYCVAEREFFKAYFGKWVLKKSERTANESAVFDRMRIQQNTENKITALFYNDEGLVVEKDEDNNV